MSQLKIRLASDGSAMRLSAVWPNQVVILSFEMDRQKTSELSDRFSQRSMRAKSPYTRGR